MRLHTYIVGVALCTVLLASCTQVQESTKQATEGAAENYEQTKKSVKNLFTYHLPSDKSKPIPPSYCYRVMQDIICYREAVAGAEGRLVAYQGSVEVPEEKETKHASLETVHQAEPAPITPVISSSSPDVPSASASHTPTPLTQSEDQEVQTEKSMEHFDKAKPVSVGAPPTVAAAEMPFAPAIPPEAKNSPEQKTP